MNRGSTTILKGVVVLIGLIVLAICLFVLPVGIRAELSGDFDYGPIFLGLYVTAVPLFIALYQALKLLGAIDRNQAFSEASVAGLKAIRNCGLAISGLFALGMPYIFYVGDRDDAPGVVAIGLVIIFASFVIATAAAVFQRLFQNAVDLKTEHDLTV